MKKIGLICFLVVLSLRICTAAYANTDKSIRVASSSDYEEENEIQVDLLSEDEDNIYNGFRYEFDSHGLGRITITEYVASSSDAEVIVPGEIDGYPVYEVSSRVFEGNKKVESVILEEGIEKIGSYCFKDCINLKHIEIPNSLYNMGPECFKNSGLVNIFIPNSSTGIKAFEDCKNLERVEFGIGTRSVAYKAFYNCISLKEVIISSENPSFSIATGAFIGCDSLEEFIIPANVKNIGETLAGEEGALTISGENLKRIVNLSNSTIKKNVFADPTDTSHVWYTEEEGGEMATEIKPYSTIYRREGIDENNSYYIFEQYVNALKKLFKRLEDEGILSSIANTHDEIIEYINKEVPEDDRAEIGRKSIFVVDFKPAENGTKANKNGIQGSFKIIVRLYTEINDVNHKIEGYGKIIPIPYKASGGSSSSGGSLSSGNTSISSNGASNSGGFIFDTVSVMGGKWEKHNEKWKLLISDQQYAKNQWAFIEDRWYAFDRNGIMLTNWQRINGRWYYLNPDGDMATGWILINGTWYWLEPTGEMVTGWKWIGEKCYYFDSNGAMWHGTTTPDGYQVDADGAWIQ